MGIKQINVYQQTKALLHKNFLQKWRMKRESLLEWSLPILLGFYMTLIPSFIDIHYVPGGAPHDLGRVDQFNISSKIIVYTPVSNITQQIMNKTTAFPFAKGVRIVGVPSREQMDKIIMQNISYAMGVIFSDRLSYKLRFFQGYEIPHLHEHDLTAPCWESRIGFSCVLSQYWYGGFVTFQSIINAAIIEITTNHSVMDTLMSVTATNMKTLPFISRDFPQNELLILFCLLCFSSLIYFVSLHVTRERKKYKELMRVMGLCDSAFWLSWGLIYISFIFIVSICLTIIITSTQIIITTGFMVIFTLFFLHGLSLMTLAFLMSVLLKKAVLSNLIVFFLNLFWGCVGFTTLDRQLPSSLQWILSICSPFAFTAGMSQLIHLDYNLRLKSVPGASENSNTMITTFSILAFDGLIYLVLALYFDKILPYGNESHYSPVFFLSSSSCLKHRRTGMFISERDVDITPPLDDHFEPVSAEFQGNAVIRIRNVTKEYKGKSGKVEALKGLFFDIYESQITALLGHSGAGKSSLLNILNGLTIPTEGSVTIYSKNVSQMQELEEIRKITGVCPQHNVQFDMLSVKENLSLFAKIKGIHPQEVEQEVQQVLLELNMQNIQNNLAVHLSEGQKRKLTFGLAILGNPQVLLLDEPTAGLDLFSKQKVWNILKERRANRVILLSTKSVDEADILADRKVVMSHGRLRCAGSSVFLKRKWGLGYYLSLYRNEICDAEQMTTFINHHIPDAKLKTETKEHIVYTLPWERTNKFPDLFRDLDNCASEGVVSYDVSMSTLNEVFINLEGKSTIEQDFHETEMRVSESLSGGEPTSSFPLEVQKTLTDMQLWRMQAWAMTRFHFLRLLRGRKTLLTLLSIFGIALFPFTTEKIISAIIHRAIDFEFETELYFLSPGQLPQETRTSLLIINNTESNIEDFIQTLKHQNILLEVDDFENNNGTEDLSYNGAIIVSGKQKDYRFSVVCNTKRLHCFPTLLNIISNGLLRMFNQTQYIRIERSPIPLYYRVWIGLPEGTSFLFFAVCSVCPLFAMNSVSDYKKKATSQLWISGLFPSAYWLGQAVVDINFFSLLLSSMFLIICLPKPTLYYFTNQIIIALVVTSFGYTVSMIFLIYVISFISRKRRKNSGLWSFCFYIIFIIMMNIFMLSNLNLIAIIASMIFIPSAALGLFVIFLEERSHAHYMEYKDTNFDLTGVDLLVCLIPYVQALLFIFVLRCMELKYGKNVIQKDPVFRISPQSLHVRPSPDELDEEEEDVQAERIRASTALTTSNLDEKPVIIASCLHKAYTGQKKNCFSKRKKTIATRNISLCVKKGEILGLLGPSGAGKSSCIRMIAGITKPTAGKVELKGWRSVLGRQGDSKAKSLGYCPQENVLWPTLTAKEQLELYATVKGLRKKDAAIVISRLVNAFKLQEQLNVPVQKLPAGTTRKLCFLLSILGDSPFLLLDEPSAGIDPVGQQQMWQVVQAAVKNTDRAVVLTTHSLAEAEALCDRVAIMVSGRLRCIGSIQHLKRKFGKHYILELKVKELCQVPLVHAEILKLFPEAAHQKRYSSLLTFKLPIADVYPLSEAFHKLETVKHNFNLEEYSLSQCTLEHVFLETSREQDMENVDEEVDVNMRWKLLPLSDEP